MRDPGARVLASSTFHGSATRQPVAVRLSAPRNLSGMPPTAAEVSVGARKRPLGSRTGALLRQVPVEVVVFGAALVSRLSVIFRDGGLRGSYGYDGPVYFAAADAFVHGRLPYRDFVLLHPPGLMLTLTPFASLTHLVSDETAFTVANLAFCALSAVNAMLVVRVCRALNLGRASAAVGGLYYATSFGAIGAEYLTKLEPLGNTFFLLALLLALRGRERSALWPSSAAGMALGVTLSVKIWWIVPGVTVLLWYVFTTRRARLVIAMAGGATVAAAAINLPFFLAAPRAMYSDVVAQQVGRHPSAGGRLLRIAGLISVPRLRTQLPSFAVGAGTVFVLVVMAAAALGAWHLSRARPAVILLVVQLVVLVAAPSFFYHYADYPSAAAAIVVAAVAFFADPTRVRSRTRLLMSRWAPVATAAAVSALIIGMQAAVVRPSPGAAVLGRSVRGFAASCPTRPWL